MDELYNAIKTTGDLQKKISGIY